MSRLVWEKYAEQKITSGGEKTFEGYVEEYHEKERRIWDILKERKLWPFVTLVDLGLIQDFKPKYGWFPLEEITTFYSYTKYLTDNKKEGLISHLHLDPEKLPWLILKAREILGDEYCQLRDSISLDLIFTR